MEDKNLNIIKSFFKDKFLNIKATRIINSPLDSLKNKKFILTNHKVKTVDDINLGVSILRPKEINEETIFILFCHGTGSNRHSSKDLFEEDGPLDRNICIMLVDYREFAESDGFFTMKNVNYDIDACIRFFKRKFSPSLIHLVGHSLGTAILLEYIKFVKINNKDKLFEKVVLFAPFSSITDVCKQFLTFKMACFLPGFSKFVETKFGYSSETNVKFVEKDSLLVVHGRNDSLVPYTQGLKIVKEGNTAVMLTEDDHDTVIRNHNAWERVFMFLEPT